MDFIDTRFVDKEIYAMAYAFAKIKNNEQSQIPIIDKKIPKRKLGYAVKKNSIPSFTATKFIKLLTKDKNKK